MRRRYLTDADGAPVLDPETGKRAWEPAGEVWRAWYRDPDGIEHTRHFDRKKDGDDWLRGVTSSIVTGTHVDPKAAKLTVNAWLDTWLEGYASRAPATLRQARVHANHIRKAFGSRRLADVRPSDVKAWTAHMKAQGLADSTVYAVHSRLAQVYRDAIHDGLVPRSPCSRRTSPPMGRQRPYVASTAQVWALHDAMPEHLRPAILLGAFAGLRIAEACGLRSSDVDFVAGIITPAVQYPAKALKTATSSTAVPIPAALAAMLATNVPDGTAWVLHDGLGRQVGPWAVERAMVAARAALVKAAAEAPPDEAAAARARVLPDGFRHHDLRHYYASVLIAAGADVKVVQARLRHASAKTTLDTYAHLWPETEEATRAAIGAAITARVASVPASLADSLRTFDVR
ncbi:MAG: hypothetical protein BGO37_08505 [Cellulomonas sp. 73-92]|uniref:tyrosine-type recombinase/integrase n=1 Tax=Cellulomonas sp. 73-92 TaxID=1895740 RepID=UPI000928AC33|nr:site-specific integrase [Cellulomonas sp. 73-92]OJV84478.1 MAG: hypothetical protein BGO37_08505 [Cellulomonas sp. 73-92]